MRMAGNFQHPNANRARWREQFGWQHFWLMQQRESNRVDAKRAFPYQPRVPLVPQTFRKSVPRWRRNGGRIFLGLLALVVIIFAVWRIKLSFYVNAELAAIRHAGLPAAPAEINTWLPAVPDSENAALALTQALGHLHEFHGRDSNTLRQLTHLNHRDTWSADSRAAALRYVESNDATLVEIAASFDRPKIRFPVDHSYGVQTELPHLAPMKRAAELLQLKTTLQSADGEPAWTNSILLQTKLAAALDSDPYLISYLVRNSMMRVAAQSAEYALNRSAPNDSTCRALRDAFWSLAQTNLLPRTFIVERAMMIPYFRMSRSEFNRLGNSSEEEENTPAVRAKPSGKGFFPLWITGFFERDLGFYLAAMQNAVQVSHSRTPESLSLMRDLNAAAARAADQKYLLSGLILPSYEKVAEKRASGEAAAILAATAFAIESYRATHNEPPEKLQALTPDFLNEIPRDPFDGNPIRYRRLARGYILYSVDTDRKDDGGKEPPAKKKFKSPIPYDITFTVER